MLQPDRRDDGHFRHDHVSCVQSSAETGFDDGQLHALLREPMKCNGREHFEISRAQRINLMTRSLDQILQLIG